MDKMICFENHAKVVLLYHICLKGVLNGFLYFESGLRIKENKTSYRNFEKTDLKGKIYFYEHQVGREF
jgi:hypothetical protein